jgi:type I restriction enzyme, S subunit
MNDLPAGWRRVTLNEIGVESQPGFASGKHNNDGRGIVHLRPMNITRDGRIDFSDVRYVEDETDRRVQAGDVLFNNTNSPALVGKTALVTNDAPLAYSNHMTRLRPPKTLRADFLAHQLHWLWASGYFKTVLNNHVNQASVDRKRLLATPIVLPPLAEQQRIVAIIESRLSQLGSALKSMSRVSMLSEDMVSAALTDAISNRARLTGWQVLTVGQMAKVSTGATPLKSRSDYYTNGSIPWVTSALLNHPFIDRIDLWITELALQETSVKLFTPGTLLLAMYGEGKTRGHVSELLISATTNQACAAIQLYPQYEDCRAWVKLVLEASYSKTRSLAAGGVQPNLSLGLVRKIPVPLPPQDIRNSILAEVDKVRSAADSLTITVKQMAAEGQDLRTRILCSAFTDGR